jgi:hypothetical protein
LTLPRGAAARYAEAMRAFALTASLLVLVACSSSSTPSGTTGATTTTSTTATTSTSTATSAGGAGQGGGATGGQGQGGASTGGAGGGASTGGAGTGGAGGAPDVTPITAPAGEWTWVDFPGAHCADGSPTGIGVNLGKPGGRALVYLEGGGACWDVLTCYSIKSAVNIEGGYDAKKFATDAKSLVSGFFDRNAPDNPFKDDSFVFVPYCTGDVHAGDNVATYGAHQVHHVGHANMAAYLTRLVPTFSGASRVVLAGSSAGGFGAALNWWQVQQAFGKLRVDMIDDSGTPMPPDIKNGGAYTAAWEKSWNLAATVPPGCADCLAHLDALFGFYGKAFPNARGALVSYSADTVLPAFFGITDAEFTQGLMEELATNIAPNPGLGYFVYGGSGHVLWFDPALATNGVTLNEFVTKMITDDPAWKSQAP